MACEALGLAPEGGAARLLADGVTAMSGALPVNPSGGVLCANPYGAAGLIRAAEAALQLRGEAGQRQGPGAPRAAGPGLTAPRGGAAPPRPLMKTPTGGTPGGSTALAGYYHVASGMFDAVLAVASQRVGETLEAQLVLKTAVGPGYQPWWGVSAPAADYTHHELGRSLPWIRARIPPLPLAAPRLPAGEDRRSAGRAGRG